MKQSACAKPGRNLAVGSLFAILLFSTISILIYVQAEGIKPVGEASIATVVLISFFLCFTIAGFLTLLSAKTIELDHRELIIHRSFPFKTKTYATSEIIKVEQNVRTSPNGSTYKIHEGYETILELSTGKKININTFEFKNYNLFNSKIQEIFNGRIDLPEFIAFEPKKFEGLGWLVFFIVIEGFLIYAIIKELTGLAIF